MTDEYDPKNLEDSQHPNHRAYADYKKLLEANQSFADWLRKEHGAELTAESMRAARDELFIDWLFDTLWPEETLLLQHQEMRLNFETRWQLQIKANQERARDDATQMRKEIERQMAAARLGVSADKPSLIGPDGRPLGGKA